MKTEFEKCTHPPDYITSDILQGDCPGHQVMWCRKCGSFKIRTFDPDYLHVHPEENSRKNYTSPWTEPAQNIDYLCPSKDLEGAIPLVLYFKNDQDADEFKKIFIEENPGCKTEKL